MPDNPQHTAPIIEVSLSPEGFEEMTAGRYGQKGSQILKAVADAETQRQCAIDFDGLMDRYNNKEYALRILSEKYRRSTKTIERWVYPRGWYKLPPKL